MTSGKTPVSLGHACSPWARRGADLPCPPAHTIDNHCGCGAAALSHDVLGHTGIVGRVRQACLADDEVVVDGDQEVGVLSGVNDVLVLEPLNLWGG